MKSVEYVVQGDNYSGVYYDYSCGYTSKKTARKQKKSLEEVCPNQNFRLLKVTKVVLKEKKDKR